jgi:hypothetical protein
VKQGKIMAPAPSKLAFFKNHGSCNHEANIYQDDHGAVAEDLPDDDGKPDEEMPELQDHHLKSNDDDEEDDDDDEEDDDDKVNEDDLSALSNVSVPKSYLKPAKHDKNFIANLRESMESLSIGHPKPYVPSIAPPAFASPVPVSAPASPVPRAPSPPSTTVSPEPSAPFLQAVPPGLRSQNPDPQVPTVPLP